MGRGMGTWTTALLIIAATSWTGAVRAAEPRQAAESPQEEILRKNGLKAMGPIYVLDTDRT